MGINLLEGYGKHLANAYTHASFVKGKTSNEWSWNGTKNINILSIVTQDLNNYNINATSNRYGTPAELQDVMQSIPVDQDKSFSIVIDKRNLKQGGNLKRSGEALRAEIAEKVVPMIDKFALGVYAAQAGQVVAESSALSTSNIIATLADIEDRMSDGFVPMEGRYAFIPYSTISLFRQALTNCDNVTDKILLKGLVGRFGTLNIVGIPSSWLPAYCDIVAFQSKSAVLPEQIFEATIKQDPQGFSGDVLEGRYLYGAGVVGAFANGCVSVWQNGHKAAALTVSVAGALTSVSGHTYQYTVDGSDPRYSKSAIKVTAAGASTSLTHTAGDTIKCVETTAGGGWSDVASVVTTS